MYQQFFDQSEDPFSHHYYNKNTTVFINMISNKNCIKIYMKNHVYYVCDIYIDINIFKNNTAKKKTYYYYWKLLIS